jgi:hypothetical protein
MGELGWENEKPTVKRQYALMCFKAMKKPTCRRLINFKKALFCGLAPSRHPTKRKQTAAITAQSLAHAVAQSAQHQAP